MGSRKGWFLRVFVLALISLAGFAAYLAWQEWRTHSFEARLIAMEVSNRKQRAVQRPSAAQTAPAPALAGDSGLRLELRARWWMVWAERSENATERRLLWQKARDELRAAAVLRPDSAFAWAALAAVKARLGSIDHEFAEAFSQAMAHGGNELRIQRQLIGILLRYPERSTFWSERAGRELARRLDRRDPYLLIALTSRYHATAWACADAKLGATMRSFCNQQGFSSSPEATP